VRLILVATGVGLIIGLFGTPFLIGLLRRHGYAQAIRDGGDGFPAPAHEAKRGTPSMGGVILVVGSVLGYVAGHIYTWRGPTATGLCVIFLMTGLAAVGFADDYIKIFKQRSTGLRARTKLIGQAGVSLAFAALALHFPDNHGLTPASQAISFVRDSAVILPVWLFLIERGEPHRRAGRARDRYVGDGVRSLRRHRRLAVPQRVRDRPGAALLRHP